MRVYIYIKRYTILHHKIPCMYIYIYIHIYIYICMYNYISKISRPTGNRAWRRWHLWITSVIQSVSNVRFRHTSIFFWLFFVAIPWNSFFDHVFANPKQRLQRVPVSHFPAPASRNWDGPAKQRLLYSFCCSLQNVFAHIDVTPLPTACVH